jgi:uncharacterized membrane protein
MVINTGKRGIRQGTKVMNGASRKYYPWWLGIAIMVHFSVLMLLGLSRHWGFMTSINDLGIYDQAVWGVLHGQSLLNTSQLNQPIYWLGFHFHPVLFLFVPLYALIPSVIWFTIAQALALSVGAWPIFLLAKRVCHSEKAGLFWALAYLINPFLLNAAAWDFHPITLAVPFVAASMLSLESKNLRLLFFSCLVILLCKEHLGVMVVGFGLLWWIKNKSWKPAIVLILIGIIHFVLVLMVIMPALSPTGEHLMLGEGLGRLSLYAWIGNSLGEVLHTILFHPIYVIKIVILGMGGAKYLLVLLIVFLGFPLAAPEYLLPGLADMMANMMSANPMPRSLFAYHSISLIPVLTVAAVYGSERISRWSKKFSVKELAGFAVITSFILGYYFAPLPIPGARNFWKPVRFLNLPDPIVHTIRYEVGDKASISAQANVGAHFSQRREIYRFPNKVGEMDAIILRLESPTKNINDFPDQLKNRRKYSISMLDSHLQMDRTEYIDTIEHLLSGSEYGILYWNDPWLVFKRGLADREPREQIDLKLNQLRKEWQISPIKS